MSSEAPERPVGAVERRVVEVLDGLGVPYELLPIDPAFADTAAYCEKYGSPLDRAANTILVASKKEPRPYAACVVKPTTPPTLNPPVPAPMALSKPPFPPPTP